MNKYRVLEQQASEVFELNRLPNGVISPQRTHFPTSFKWDAGHTARGRVIYDTHDAMMQVYSHLMGQHTDGKIPNEVVFSPLNFAQKSILRYKRMPTGVGTSNITQPPNLATASRDIAERLSAADQRTYLRSVYPQLLQETAWLLEHRADKADGLITLLHPYESGMDNSPIWDNAMTEAWREDNGGQIAKIMKRWSPAVVEHFRKKQGDLRFGGTAERSQTEEIINGQLQTWQALRHGHDIDAIREKSRAALIKDVGFNAIAAAANVDLLWMEETLDEEQYRINDDLRAAIERQRQAIETELWDSSDRAYYSKDARTNELIRVLTVGSLLPLLIAESTERADSIVARVTDTDQFWTLSPIPSVSVSEPSFNPNRYWRGGAWSLTRIFVFEALKKQGYCSVADSLAEQVLEQEDAARFGEFNNPLTGQALGMKPFSPAAAEVLMYIEHLKS